ncbi:hypothetical protein ACHAXM_000251 [Skeletonema potamos]
MTHLKCTNKHSKLITIAAILFISALVISYTVILVKPSLLISMLKASATSHPTYYPTYFPTYQPTASSNGDKSIPDGSENDEFDWAEFSAAIDAIIGGDSGDGGNGGDGGESGDGGGDRSTTDEDGALPNDENNEEESKNSPTYMPTDMPTDDTDTDDSTRSISSQQPSETTGTYGRPPPAADNAGNAVLEVTIALAVASAVSTVLFV